MVGSKSHALTAPESPHHWTPAEVQVQNTPSGGHASQINLRADLDYLFRWHSVASLFVNRVAVDLRSQLLDFPVKIKFQQRCCQNADFVLAPGLRAWLCHRLSMHNQICRRVAGILLLLAKTFLLRIDMP